MTTRTEATTIVTPTEWLREMRTAIVLVGAGASHDAADSGATVVEEWRPPLVRDLFDIGSHPQYGELLQDYPEAQFITHGLAERAQESTFSLETELRRLACHPDPRMRWAFMQIPRYLAALFGWVSHAFTSSPGSYCRLIQELLAEVPHRVAFISLNYDNLLEQAMVQFHSANTFATVDDYCATWRQAIVVKPHGSANWRRPCEVLAKEDWIGTFHCVTFPNGPAALTVSNGHQNGRLITIYPALTAPLASKDGEQFVCPASHIGRLRGWCRKAKKLLLIGTSCLDADILTILAQECPAPALMQVVFRGSEIEVNQMRDRILGHWPSIRHPQLEFFSDGFREYLNSERFRFFAHHGHDADAQE